MTAGPCRAAKPWGWNAIESAKWSSWTQLGDMPALDAMKMYVSTMEEENPDWYDLVTDGGDPERVAEVLEMAADAVAAAGIRAGAEAERRARADAEAAASASAATPRADPSVDRIVAEDGVWADVSSQISGKFPRGRYAHAVATVGDDVFVVGGNSSGRRLADAHVLNLPTMTWRRAETKSKEGEDEFTARAGHAAVVWGTKIVVVGGHVRDASEDARTDAWVLETKSMEWSRLPLEGPANAAPLARGGHSATLVRGAYGAKIVVFGGEDRRGRLLDDVHVVDLQTMRWSTPESPLPGAAPTPRAGHVAASFGAGAGAVTNVFVFGGVARGLAGEVSGELFVLDTMAMTWRAVHPAGAAPVPRAYAAGAVVGDAWYITGGGGADGGRRDTVALRVSAVEGELEWTSAAEVDAGSSLAAEGAGIVAVGGGAALLAFGGYDGARYSADVHLLKRPQAGRLAMTKTKILSPVKTDPRRNSVDVDAARTKSPARVQTPPPPRSTTSTDPAALARELEQTKARLAEAREALAGKEAETTRLRAELDEERAKVSRLEATLAKTESATAESRRPKGVWGFLSGDAPEYKGAPA